MTSEHQASARNVQGSGTSSTRGRLSSVAASRHFHWRDAAFGLVLSVVPGLGHLHAGEVLRGLVWALVFALLVVPLGVLGFVVWSFSPQAPVTIAVAILTLLVVAGLGPATRVLRGGPRLRPDAHGSPRRWPSPRGLSISALLLVAVFAAELTVAAVLLLERGVAATDSLAPVMRRGDETAVVVSTYVRPVHGDVVLLAPTGGPAAPSTAPSHAARRVDPFPEQRHLARIRACPRDVVELRAGHLVVNGITLRADDRAQRRELEKSGRRLRRYRFVTEMFASAPEVPESFWRFVPLGGDDWQLRVPDGFWLVLPDIEEQGASSEPPSGWLVSRSEVLGRAVLWAR